MIHLGDTFFSKGHDNHLHVVISEPGEDNADVLVLVVRITSFRSEKIEDTSCELFPEDGHPAIKHHSVVNYGEIEEPKCAPLYAWNKAVNEGLLILQQPFVGEVLERILAGARKSNFLRNEFKELIPEPQDPSQ